MRTRLVAVGLAAVLTLGVVATAVAIAPSGIHGAHATKPDKVAFHDAMRKLWEDHVTWTRLFIVSAATLPENLPDTGPTAGRLLANQDDIGDALRPFYGDEVGDAVTALLREHILIAADIIAAAKAGDADGVANGQARWRANADEIAAFLNAANPRSWKLDEMKEMLYEHLSVTTTEVVFRLTGDWDADVAAYDQIHVQALEMADELSTGIVKQFRHRFR